MFADLARTYSTIFTPELFVLLCGLLLLGYEWRGLPGRSGRGLGARICVFALGWTVGLAVYLGVPRVVGPLAKWENDALGSIGLVIGLAVIWSVWRLRDWGHLVPLFAGLLVVVSVPHLLITPFWDISTHVLYAVVPAGALAWADRRFAVLAVVPLGMVFARPLAGVHTWPESVGGLVLGCLAVAAFVRVATVRGLRRPPETRAEQREATGVGDA